MREVNQYPLRLALGYLDDYASRLRREGSDYLAGKVENISRELWLTTTACLARGQSVANSE